jgi:threonine dehydrogenase-like Zn-dependent dehydrogenase
VELGIIGHDGGFAEYLATPGRYIHKLPPELSLRRAALCEPLAIILKGLNRLAQFWPTDPEIKRCAVVGGGSFGHLCAKVLYSRGHQVTVFDRDPKRRGYFQGTGIEASDDLQDLYDFDVLAEVTGDPAVLDTLLLQSGPTSTILLLDLPYADKQIFLGRFLAHDKAIIGSSGSTPQDFEDAIALLPRLDVDLLLQCVFPLEQFHEALETFKQRRYLKVMLEVSGDSN